jgi:hypothetical protein
MTPLVAAIIGLGGALVFFGRSSHPSAPQAPTGFGGGINPFQIATPPRLMTAPISAPSRQSSAAPGESEIEAAYHVALLKETSVSDLRSFGTALCVLGYNKEGSSLFAKAMNVKASPSDSSSKGVSSKAKVKTIIVKAPAAKAKPKTVSKPKPTKAKTESKPKPKSK